MLFILVSEGEMKMENPLQKRLESAVRAALLAGENLTVRSSLTIAHKSANDYVTDADRSNEELIRSVLLKEWPEDGFLGEEEGEIASQSGRWIVDPIDGTTNFIYGLPLYTISIAYEEAGALVLGCVYCPPLKEMFTAVRGHGAYLNGRPIHPRETAVLRDALIGMAFAHRDDAAGARMLRLIPRLRSECSDLRRLGSAALDLCFVACGRYDAFIEPALHIYDIAAGLVILREAGGLAESWPGDQEPVEITCNVFAASKSIHDALREVMLQADG